MNTSFFIYKHNSLHYFNLFENFNRENAKNILFFVLQNSHKKSGIKFSLNSVKKPFNAILNKAVNKNVRVWENTFDDKNYLLTNLEDNVLYDGFFQSEEYFHQFQEDIKHLFEIKKQFQSLFLEKKKQLFEKKSVVIHLRRKDYLNHGDENFGGKDLTLPVSYYRKCISLIKDIDQYNVIFVSDDIAFAKKEFGYHENYFYEYNEEIIDFQILLNASILIIANSTFSWWAAWLNKKADKVIYAPNYFFGFNVKKFYPAGIKVDAWNWIDVK